MIGMNNVDASFKCVNIGFKTIAQHTSKSGF